MNSRFHKECSPNITFPQVIHVVLTISPEGQCTNIFTLELYIFFICWLIFFFACDVHCLFWFWVLTTYSYLFFRLGFIFSTLEEFVYFVSCISTSNYFWFTIKWSGNIDFYIKKKRTNKWRQKKTNKKVIKKFSFFTKKWKWLYIYF